MLAMTVIKWQIRTLYEWRATHFRPFDDPGLVRTLDPEPLHPFPVPRLAGVEIPARVQHHHVGADELAGLTTGATEPAQDLQVIASQHPHTLVGAVNEIEETLLGIA